MSRKKSLDELRKQLMSIVEAVASLKTNLKDDEPDDHSKDLGDLPYRVIHLKDNPSNADARAREKQFEDLKVENERLKARLEILESGNNADVTRQIDVAVNNANLKDEMTSKLEEYKRREEKILDSFRKTSRNYRRAVSSLTGFKIDVLKDGIYNLYLDEMDHSRFLSFKISSNGDIHLIENEFSNEYSRNQRTYIYNADSFPAFLASITLDLFKSSTQLEPVSMCMSTTIIPNTDYKPV